MLDEVDRKYLNAFSEFEQAEADLYTKLFQTDIETFEAARRRLFQLALSIHNGEDADHSDHVVAWMMLLGINVAANKVNRKRYEKYQEKKAN